MLNKNEHLLACLSEEAGEISQIVGKILRFGLFSEYKGESNLDRLSCEINDLLAVMEMLIDAGVDITVDKQLIAMKKARVEEYMVYSKDCGTLEK